MLARLLAVVAVVLMSAFVAGCGFTPVYGSRGAAPQLAAASFNFSAPTNALERIIINRLISSFPTPPTESSPTLTVRAAGTGGPGPMSNAISVSETIRRVEATLTIVGADGEAFTVTRFSDIVYQSGSLSPTSAMNAIGAEQTAARSTAESLRAAILATYRP